MVSTGEQGTHSPMVSTAVHGTHLSGEYWRPDHALPVVSTGKLGTCFPVVSTEKQIVPLFAVYTAERVAYLVGY